MTARELDEIAKKIEGVIVRIYEVRVEFTTKKGMPNKLDRQLIAVLDDLDRCMDWLNYGVDAPARGEEGGE